MLDLCLIQLPNPVLANPKMYNPLGILYLAAVVEKVGYTVEIADFRDGDIPLPEARFYGFSCTTPEIVKAKEIASQVSGQTIIGGAHPSLFPEDCIKHFDYVVRGEGEEVITQILDGKYEPSVVITPRIKDVNKLPLPAWHKIKNPFTPTLFPGERYGTGELAMTILASRGCPFKCAFCGNLLRRPMVYRSVESIVTEIVTLTEMGVRYFRFEDDNLTLHPQFNRLCSALKVLGISFKGHTRSDILTSHHAELLKLAGMEECGIGVESADDIVLGVNNKNETAQQHRSAIHILKSHGIRVKTYFMSGLPGETDETIEINKQFMADTKPDKWTLSTFTPYPGCDIFNNPNKYNIEINDWDFSKWWNFAEGHFVHTLKGQTQDQMWQRYLNFYTFLKGETWQSVAK